MALVKLHTENFRNLGPAPAVFSPSFNLLYGENGSGKTSFLEAIGYLGLGRSFRINRHQAVAAHGTDKFTVFGGLDNGLRSDQVAPGREPLAGAQSQTTGYEPPDNRSAKSDLERPKRESDNLAHRLGLSRCLSTKETQLRVDGEAVRSLSALAMHFPVSIIDPGVFDIVTGGPGKRRQFLDWSVFHVEPSFATKWQQCQRVTSQRNQTLRNGRIDDSLIRVWDSQYVALAYQITDARKATFELFQGAFESLLKEVNAPWVSGLTLEFFPGWDRNLALADVLTNHREQEQRVGHTLYGPNRADIRMRFQGRPVSETFSRGQQKTLVILMKIAQGIVLKDLGKQATFLLDDINAELDVDHRAMLAEKLRELRCQVFMTSIERPQPERLWLVDSMPEFKMFHVEHGELTEE